MPFRTYLIKWRKRSRPITPCARLALWHWTVQTSIPWVMTSNSGPSWGVLLYRLVIEYSKCLTKREASWNWTSVDSTSSRNHRDRYWHSWQWSLFQRACIGDKLISMSLSKCKGIETTSFVRFGNFSCPRAGTPVVAVPNSQTWTLLLYSANLPNSS